MATPAEITPLISSEDAPRSSFKHEEDASDRPQNNGAGEDRWRWWLLLLVSLVPFGAHVMKYAISPLIPMMLRDEYTHAQLGLLTSAVSVPNFVMPVFGGVALDVFDARLVLLALLALTVLGHAVFWAALVAQSFGAALLGRVLFGLGQGSTVVAQGALTADWFVGRELAFAVGIAEASHNLAGAVAQVYAVPAAERLGGYAASLGAGTGFLLLSLLAGGALCWVASRHRRRSHFHYRRPLPEPEPAAAQEASSAEAAQPRRHSAHPHPHPHRHAGSSLVAPDAPAAAASQAHEEDSRYHFHLPAPTEPVPSQQPQAQSQLAASVGAESEQQLPAAEAKSPPIPPEAASPLAPPPVSSPSEQAAQAVAAAAEQSSVASETGADEAEFHTPRESSEEEAEDAERAHAESAAAPGDEQSGGAGAGVAAAVGRWSQRSARESPHPRWTAAALALRRKRGIGAGGLAGLGSGSHARALLPARRFSASFALVCLLHMLFSNVYHLFGYVSPDFLREKYGYAPERAAYVASVTRDVAFFLGPLAGLLFDRFGGKLLACSGAGVLTALAYAALAFAPADGPMAQGHRHGHHPHAPLDPSPASWAWAYFGWLVPSSPLPPLLALALCVALVPTAVRASVPLVVDSAVWGRAFGLFSVAEAVGAFVGHACVGYLRDESGSYRSALVLLIALSLLAALLALLASWLDWRQSGGLANLSAKRLRAAMRRIERGAHAPGSGHGSADSDEQPEQQERERGAVRQRRRGMARHARYGATDEVGDEAAAAADEQEQAERAHGRASRASHRVPIRSAAVAGAGAGAAAAAAHDEEEEEAEDGECHAVHAGWPLLTIEELSGDDDELSLSTDTGGQSRSRSRVSSRASSIAGAGAGAPPSLPLTPQSQLQPGQASPASRGLGAGAGAGAGAGVWARSPTSQEREPGAVRSVAAAAARSRATGADTAEWSD